MEWTLTGGEARHIHGRCLSIDGISNAIEFLERLENGTLGNFDFLEMRACDKSCAGGILSSTNRFLVSERLHKRAEQYYIDKGNGKIFNNKTITLYKDYVIANASLHDIEPRSIMKLDEDMVLAMKKMQKIQKIKGYLPGIDCAACGAPGCRALAEDVVQGRARTSDCVFVAIKVKGGETMSQVAEYTEEIWGRNRFKNMLPE